MKAQSLSIVVPNKVCINDCKFCVSRMHTNDYKNQMDENLPFYDLYFNDYIKRLEYAKDAGCDTVMLTGSSEPQQNRHFLMMFGVMMRLLKQPFKSIEIQTTGRNLDENYLRFLRNHVGVSTISLSVASFDDVENNEIIGNNGKQIILEDLCAKIKKYDFNLRLSINMTKSFDHYFINNNIENFFLNISKKYQADQVTFRVLYTSLSKTTKQDEWIINNQINPDNIKKIKDYIIKNGKKLDILPFGLVKYSINNMSVVLDDDCMSAEAKEIAKYLILRENCKLYSKWDDQGSLIF